MAAKEKLTSELPRPWCAPSSSTPCGRPAATRDEVKGSLTAASGGRLLDQQGCRALQNMRKSHQTPGHAHLSIEEASCEWSVRNVQSQRKPSEGLLRQPLSFQGEALFTWAAS